MSGDNSDKMSDRMSSVSNSSKFSVKSQQVIAIQDSQISKMRKMMIAAGLDPDADPGVDLEQVPDLDAGVLVDLTRTSKKRMPGW